MNSNGYKIVNFYKFCPKCEHYSKPESEDPCRTCLGYSTNYHSRKPVKFKEKRDN